MNEVKSERKKEQECFPVGGHLLGGGGWRGPVSVHNGIGARTCGQIDRHD